MTLADEYRGLTMWAAADEVSEAIEGKTALSEQDRDRLKRAEAQAALVKSQRSANPLALPSSWRQLAEQTAANLTEIARQIEGWDDSAAMAYPTINALDTCGDVVLGNMRVWPVPLRVERARQVVEVAEAFETAAEAELEGLRSRSAALAAELTVHEANAETLSSGVASQAARMETIKSSLDADLNASITSARTEVSTALDEADGRFAQMLKAQETRGAEALKSIDDKAEAARKLMVLIGGAGIADGYTAYANTQRRAAFGWSLAAVILGVMALVFVAWILYDTKDQTSPSVPLLVLKGGVTVTALTVAGYMTRLGAHHRAQAVKARFRALDMLALGPFAEELNEEQGRDLKYRVGLDVFGRAEDPDKQPVADRLREVASPPQ